MFFLAVALALASPATAEGLSRREIQFTIERDLTVIWGEVVDSDTGSPVAGAAVVAAMDSGFNYEVQTDVNGRFVIVVTEDGDHDYVLSFTAIGYDPKTVNGSIKFGENQHLTIGLKYNPFDLQLSESYGTMNRGYTAYSYTGRRFVPFTAQRTVPVLDERGNPVYDVVEERVLTGYTWEERITVYQTETYTVQVSIPVPRYTTVRYVSGWNWVKVGWIYLRLPVYSTRQVLSGYSVKYVTQTLTRQVPHDVWVTRSSTTRPDFLDNPARLQDGSIRNVREIYTVILRQVPRTRVETYTAYRIYDYGGTYYTFLPWSSRQTTVIVTPKNGYSGSVLLRVESGGLEASLGATELKLSSSTSTTLTMTPRYASTHVLTLRALDPSGRLVRTCSYRLNAIESLPSPESWERYVWTALEPDYIPATIVSTRTYIEEINTQTKTEVPSVELDLSILDTFSGKLGGPIYDGGTFGGPMTRFWTVNYMQPVRPDGTLNYVNQKAWELVYDMKIRAQPEPYPIS
ncbi:MAG: carboxypeptidase regulatory-like domain-containing protein [Candidatus Hadarchaeum sp.]|uniref:carboxypeptidase regulatory-like domain-containing protein n=1 Tax=Candidatus Hadarchaeum sp. TaxID=2883567 RepID=UPI003D0EF272